MEVEEALGKELMHLSMFFPRGGGDTLGIRPTKNHFPQEFERTL